MGSNKELLTESHESMLKKIGQGLDSGFVDGFPLPIYDNGGESLDRITVVLPDGYDGYRYCLNCSLNGAHVFTHGTCLVGDHLGKRATLADLTPELRGKVLDYYFNNIKTTIL